MTLTAPQRMRALPNHAGRDGIDALRGVPSAVQGRRFSLGKAHPKNSSLFSAAPRLSERKLFSSPLCVLCGLARKIPPPPQREEEFRRTSRRGAEAQGRFGMGERPAPQRMRALPIHAGREGIDALRGVPSAVQGRRLSLGKTHPKNSSRFPAPLRALRDAFRISRSDAATAAEGGGAEWSGGVLE